jgi:hypothetical protein
MNENPNQTPQLAYKAAACTLFEGDYHLGLAALVNSLAQAGFQGTFWAGYRGALPPWLHQLKALDAPGEYMVGEHIRLVFVPVEARIHFTNYKPQFMLELLANRASEYEYIWYFDPDITVRCGWSFFATWQRYGIALCQDMMYIPFAETDLLRQQWAEIATAMGLGKPRPLIQHFNAGMVGVAAEHTSFLQLWKRLIDQTAEMGYDLTGFLPGTRELPLHATDQDALNIAAMYTEHPLSTMGPEAMGFVNGGFTMYHAVVRKPWRGSLIGSALSGYPASDAIKYFFTQVSSPIRAYSPWRLRGKKLACKVAGFIGRFYARR